MTMIVVRAGLDVSRVARCVWVVAVVDTYNPYFYWQPFILRFSRLSQKFCPSRGS